METIAQRVVRRFTAFKYEPKEKKKSKVDRLSKLIREKTGLSNSQAQNIADAIVRGRDVETLARQKSLPVEDGKIEGPKGTITVDKVKSEM
jgi:hypothetical protein